MRGRFFGRLGGDRGRGGPAGARACRRYGPVVLCSALVFGWAGWQVTVRGAVRGFDERLGREVAAGGVPGPLAQFFADLGNTVVALPVLVAVAGWVWWRLRRGTGDGPGGTDGTDGPGDGVRAWLPPVAALGTLAAVPALVVPFKVWLDRPGPPRMAGVHEGFFPSGHGATAAVAYGLVALLLIRAYAVRHGRRTVRRRGTAAAPAARVVAAGAGLLNVGVGLGLVRQGYHWPLDVLGGWCLAGVLLPLWCVVCERWGMRTGGGDPEPTDRPDMP